MFLFLFLWRFVKRVIGRPLILIGAIVAGNLVGDQLSAYLGSQSSDWEPARTKGVAGETTGEAPLVTRFYPALAIALIGKPRWLYAFLGGVLTSTLLSNQTRIKMHARVTEFMAGMRDELGSSQ